MKKLVTVIAFLVLTTSGCAGFIRTGMGAATPIFDSAITAAMSSKDPMVLGEGAPGLLLILSGLSAFAPDNRYFLVAASEFYTAYALGFVEDKDPERARVLYKIGRDYGLKALNMNSGFKKALAKGKPMSEAAKKLKKRDMDALFWTAASWAAYMNLSTRDTESLFDIPNIMALLSRTVELDDTFWNGGPHMFFAAYYSQFPAMMGGGAEKAQKEFDAVTRIVKKQNGEKAEWLIADYFYAKYYATLLKDEELFDKTIKKILDAPDDSIPSMAAVNGLAKIKTRILLEQKGRYF
ncbi:MAG: TRAP transporter TatT component family protein [bacterium]|nr:TRAP transporter TatT component family protein [bacterium]